MLRHFLPISSFKYVDGLATRHQNSEILNSENAMKELLKLATEIGKSSVLDGTINANDLRNNKKQLAVKLAKTAAWTLVHADV